MQITVTVTEAEACLALLDSYGDFEPCTNDEGDCNTPGSPGCNYAWHQCELDAVETLAAKMAKVAYQEEATQ